MNINRISLLILGVLGIIMACILASIADSISAGLLDFTLFTLTVASLLGGFASIGAAFVLNEESLPELFKR